MVASRRFSIRRPHAALLGMLILSVFLIPTPKAQADVCFGAGDEFGQCFLNFTTHAGEFPFAITIDEAASRVIVVDLFSGIFYKYDKNDIAMPPSFFFGPVGAATYTGVAHEPVDNALYWIVDQGMGQELVRSDVNGVFVSSVPIASPAGGTIGEITYSEATSSFWGLDITEDVVFEFDAMGVTSTSFPQPGISSFGGGVFGVGITAVNGTALDPVRLDVATGLPSDQRAQRVMRVNGLGEELGLNFTVDDENSLSGWVTGIVFTELGSTGIPSEYGLDVTNNLLVEIKVGTDDPSDSEYSPTVVDVNCSVDADGNVTLNWNNRVPYNNIEIFRDGVSIAVLTGTETSPGAQTFMDMGVEDGLREYELQATTNGTLPLSNNEICQVVVGPGRLVNSTPHNGSDALAITVVDSTTLTEPLVYVVDLGSGTTHRYTKSLVFVDTINSPFGMNVTTGLTWRSTSDTLFWFDADMGMLQETDLTGTTIGAAVPLVSPEGGAIADIAYAALTDTFWGADITEDVYFEFNADGTLVTNATSVITFDQLGLGSSSGFGNGITVIDDATLVALDVIAGPDTGTHADQIVRVIVDPLETPGTPVFLDPITNSGFNNGIAWTAEGSTGDPAEYIICNDTNTIYEISLSIPGVQFRRGDANDSGAVDIPDVTTILNFVFGIDPMAVTCQDAADVNDDGQVNIADITPLLNGIFGIAGPQPQPPFPLCGVDMTPSLLTCDSYTNCP